MTGHETGGVVSGPDTGFLSKLHGNEAIIPLPENISSEELPEYLQKTVTSSSSFADILDNVRNAGAMNNQQQNDLMQVLISKVDQLIDATRDVANHTETTAMRVA